MIEVQELTKTFGSKKTVGVDRLSFSAHAGEVFGFLGPNGAGKTTTLRMLATILQPSSGSAQIAGHDLVREPLAVRSKIGFLSGDMGLYHRLTPRETLMCFGRLNGVEESRLPARVAELMKLFLIEDYANARIDKLSTGMRQKVAIARTVIHDPPVIILDEPTSGLDVPAAGLVEQFIKNARNSGKCIIFSTHIMEEAEYLCDRIAVIHAGKLKALGTMDELRQQTGKQRLREVFLALLGMSPEAVPVGGNR